MDDNIVAMIREIQLGTGTNIRPVINKNSTEGLRRPLLSVIAFQMQGGLERAFSVLPTDTTIRSIELLCRRILEPSIALFPGLEQYSLQRVDEIIADLIPRDLRPAPGRSFHRQSGVVNVFTHFVRDHPSLRNAMESFVRNALMNLAGAYYSYLHGTLGRFTVEQIQRLEDELLIFEWLFVFMRIYRISYNYLCHVRVTDHNRAHVGLSQALTLAEEIYQDLLTHGDLEIHIPSEIYQALGLFHYGPRLMLILVLRAEDCATNAVPNEIRRFVLPNANNDSNRLILITRPTATRQQVHSAAPPPTPEAAPASTQKLASNEPDHVGNLVHNAPIEDLHRSVYHGKFSIPHDILNLAITTDVHQVMIYFDACRHYNAVHVAKLELLEVMGIATKCGCSKFPADMVASRRATSCDKCLICRWTEDRGRTHTGDESENDWKDICFDRQVEMIEAGTRKMSLWPFGADDP